MYDSLSSIFRKLVGMTLLPTLTLTVLLQRNTVFFLFSLLLLFFTFLTLNAAKSSFPFAASNANPKPGDSLKRMKRLVKEIRLSLPLMEAMKIVRLTSPLADMPRLLLPK